MPTVKMAISSGDSTSILYSAQKIAKTIYRPLTLCTHVSDDTLDTFVGLCAGRGALLRIQRKKSAKLIRRLSATQTHTPILDDATWAAEVGGGIVGEIEGHRSHRSPWAEPNFGIKFLYRRAADEAVSSQEQKYPIYPHDGSLYSSLLRWKKTSALVPRLAAQTVKPGPDLLPVSSKLPRTPLSTPPSNSTSKKISLLPTATDCPRRQTPTILITPITPPTSPTADKPSVARDDIPVEPNSRQQVRTKRPKPSPASAALLSLLFSKEKERALSRRQRARRTQPNQKKHAKEIPEVHSNEETGDDSESCMGSLEVAAMRRQQNQRLQRKELAPPADFERNETDHTLNKPQARPIKVGGVVRGPRVHFREREPTRRRAPARAIATKAA